MTQQPDYTTWTWEQHLAKASELAAKADQHGDNEIPSQALGRMHDVQQIAARGWLHAKLAELKKPDSTESVIAAAPLELEAGVASVTEAPAKAKPQQQPRKRGV